MKKNLLLLMFSIFPFLMIAQKLKTVTKNFPNSKVIKSARPQIYVQAKYPPLAREEGLEGIVIVKFKLDKACEVTELKVLQSLRADCDAAAIEGVKDFIERLKYYEEDCKEFEEQLTIEFKLE